ncbi:MAG: hypothetical protein J7J61_09150 [Candidatus Hydrothermae bacterium]|nr:hypothetical protein [Candidatus Hydrothermae bacterium]
MRKLKKVRSKPRKGFLYRVIGYDKDGQQVGYADAGNLAQAVFAQEMICKAGEALTTVIYNTKGELIGGHNLDVLKNLSIR